MQLTITTEAAARMKQALQAEGKPDYGLRLVAQRSECGCGSGCGGSTAYGLYPEPSAQAEDTVVEEQGVKLFIDQTSLPLLEGVKIDFVNHPEQGEGFLIEPAQDEDEGQEQCDCGGDCDCKN